MTIQGTLKQAIGESPGEPPVYTLTKGSVGHYYQVETGFSSIDFSQVEPKSPGNYVANAYQNVNGLVYLHIYNVGTGNYFTSGQIDVDVLAIGTR